MNETKTIDIAWAVEFGGSAVRRVRLTRTDGGYCADHYADAPLPARWTTEPNLSAAAMLLPAEEIASPLAACLGNDLVLYRTIRLPRVDEATLEKMILSQLETLLPTQVEKFATAWSVQADPVEANLQHVLLTAVRRESLATVTGVCARWRKGGADVTPSLSALANAWMELSGVDESVLLMDIGARSTATAIVQGRRVWRCAVVDSGGDAWTERIARAMNVSCEDAETRKLQAASGDDPTFCKSRNEALFAWAGGVKEAYDDCLAETPLEARPTRCVIFGRAGRLAGVAAKVSAALGIPAAIAETPDTLCLEAGVAFDSVAPLVGAAIGAMQNSATMIRLARRKEDKPAATKRKRGQWAAAMGWFILGIAGLYAMDLYEASRAERMADAVYRETYHQGGLKRQSAVGNYLENGAPVPLDILERISRAAPDSTILTSLNYSRSGETSLQGTIANEQQCQEFLKKLSELGKVELRRARPDQDRFRFEINLSLARSFGAANKPAAVPAATAAPTVPTAPAETPGVAAGSVSVPPPASSPAAETSPAPAATTTPASMPTEPTATNPASQPATLPAGGVK